MYRIHKLVRLSRGFKTLVVTKSDGVCWIELNRPSKKNAFNVPMYTELSQALDAASSDPDVKVALLSGRGDYYSSGNDLSNFSQLMHPLEMARRSKAL
jgi:peroxisomal 3,2-trans-enoyl-CoA isomerase